MLSHYPPLLQRRYILKCKYTDTTTGTLVVACTLTDPMNTRVGKCLMHC